MLTAQHILTAFNVLEDAGLRPPPGLSDPARRARSAKVWAASMTHLTDAQLTHAIAAFLRRTDRDARFWPTPGALLDCLDSGPTADDLWGHLLGCLRLYGTYKSPLDPGQRVEDVHASDPRLDHGVFVLHEDPAICSRLWRGLHAIGGWTGLRELPADPTAQAPMAAAFRRAVDAQVKSERAGTAKLIGSRTAIGADSWEPMLSSGRGRALLEQRRSAGLLPVSSENAPEVAS